MSSAATMRSLMGRGLGATTTSSEINTGLVTSGAVSSALLAITGATAAIPVVGAIVAGVTAIISAFGIGNGCGQGCVVATQIVNQVIPLMQQNLAAAQQQLAANGGCLTTAEQQQCVANFNALWQQIVQGCTQIGNSACITDRQPGGKYDCFATLLDPIQAMPVCAASSTAANSASGISSNVLIGGALIAAALLLLR